MKIGILNLPFDNNYGGNLQRFALIKVLLSKGYDVKHINLKSKYVLPWYKIPYSYSKRFLMKYVMESHVSILQEREKNKKKIMAESNAVSFYQKYIPHTNEAYTLKDIYSIVNNSQFDAVIVGSDQVWRKSMTGSIGFENFFLKFVGDDTVKIAYSVSLGSSHCEYTSKEVKKIKELYGRFVAVSVREKSALDIFSHNEWNVPEAVWTLDPTLLLSQKDYNELIKKSNVADLTNGKIFCYSLDMNDNIKSELDKYGLDYVKNDLYTSGTVSIEQWLNNIKQSQMVITDSYHGVVFSIIYNKPFRFMGNARRGNDRIDSLFSMLGIDENNTLDCDWNVINERICKLKEKSLSFLMAGLNSNKV